MSITITADAIFQAVSTDAPTGLTGTIGIQINQGATVIVPRATTGIVEFPVASGIYTATLTAPAEAGGYQIVWDTGGGSPLFTEEDLTVITAPTAITDLVTVKALLQKDDARQDSLIDQLIPRASRAIFDYVKRELVDLGLGATRVLRFTEQRLPRGEAMFVPLRPWDAQTITQVRLDVDGTQPTTLTVDQYLPSPAQKSDGVWNALEVVQGIPRVGLTSSWETRTIEITGTWGFPVVPDVAIQACALAVGYWLRQDMPAFGPLLQIDEQQGQQANPYPTAPGQLPWGARSLLNDLRRPAV